MARQIPLDESIVATLTGDCSSDQAAAVLAEAKRVLTDLTRQADTADVASLSPLATSAEARDLRQSASDHRFEADRMEASVSALESRVADLTDAEARARRQGDLGAVTKVRDELAADIAREYPEIVERLTSLAKRIMASDRECSRVRIDSAEAVGRGISPGFYSNCGPLHRITDRAPATLRGARLAWEKTGAGLIFFGPDDRPL